MSTRLDDIEARYHGEAGVPTAWLTGLRPADVHALIAIARAAERLTTATGSGQWVAAFDALKAALEAAP